MGGLDIFECITIWLKTKSFLSVKQSHLLSKALLQTTSDACKSLRESLDIQTTQRSPSY